MRDIKFRAFDRDRKDMEYIDDFYWFEESGVHDSEGIGHHADYILMQFTGLKDKNGKDIYEGDICTIWMGVKQDNPYVVEDLRELYLDMNHADSYYRITKIEIVGNIYENPELLIK